MSAHASVCDAAFLRVRHEVGLVVEVGGQFDDPERPVETGKAGLDTYLLQSKIV